MVRFVFCCFLVSVTLILETRSENGIFSFIDILSLVYSYCCSSVPDSCYYGPVSLAMSRIFHLSGICCCCCFLASTNVATVTVAIYCTLTTRTIANACIWITSKVIRRDTLPSSW